MSITSPQLVGYMKSQFSQSAKMRIWLFFIQFCAAIPGAISVLTDSHVFLYILAVLGAFLLVIYTVLAFFYARANDAAQAARRAALIIDGLGESLSASAFLDLRQRFTVDSKEADKWADAQYYASKLPPGPSRLSQIIEESAFFSEDLQSVSASAMLLIIVLFAVCALIIALSIVPFVGSDVTVVFTRLVLAVLVFVLSSDVLGAFFLHRSSAKLIGNVRSRLAATTPSELHLGDVLLAMADYNAAVEAAPESVPFAYRVREKSLNQRWASYLEDKRF